MPGKWTDRGIEDSHGHLIADREGTVVCTKRKKREEIPVGKMILEQIKDPHELPIVRGSAIEKLLENDPWFGNLRLSLQEANRKARRSTAEAVRRREDIIRHIKEVAYREGLAAPNPEELNKDKRFACPNHPDSRFLWQSAGFISETRISRYQRSCFECSLPPHFRETSKGPSGGKLMFAYECPCCGIVLGDVLRKKNKEWAYSADYYCTLCGEFLARITADMGR